MEATSLDCVPPSINNIQTYLKTKDHLKEKDSNKVVGFMITVIRAVSLGPVLCQILYKLHIYKKLYISIFQHSTHEMCNVLYTV